MQTIYVDESISANRRIPVYLVDATDGYTPETGVTTPTIEISKNGAAQASGGGSFVEVGDGIYYYETTLSEVDTKGILMLRVLKSGVSREFVAFIQVKYPEVNITFTPPKISGFDIYDYYQSQDLPVFIEDANGRVSLGVDNITTPGGYFVIRYRQDAQTVLQSGTLSTSTTNGLNVYFTFDPEAGAGLLPGDSVSIIFLNTVVTVNEQVIGMPTISIGPLAVFDSISESGAVQSGSTSTSIITNITGPGDDTYKGMQLQIVSNFGGSTPVKLTRQITNYVMSTGTFTVFPAFPTAPVADDIVLVLANYTEDNDAKERMLGLLHENIVVEHTFIGDNHVQSDYWHYNSKANANLHDKSTGLLFTYSLVTEFDANDKPSKTTMVRDS